MGAVVPTLDEIRAIVQEAVEPLREEVAKLRAEAEQPVSVAEAANRLGVSRRTIQRRIKDGSLPAVRVGGVVRVQLGSALAGRDAVAALARDALTRGT